MTEFEFFIACLPEWDGKDRVTELEKLVKAETKIFIGRKNECYCRDYSDKWVRRVLKEVLRGVTDIFFIGEQGIGKSTLISHLFPFESIMCQNSFSEEKLIANCVSVHEVEELPNLPTEYAGTLFCNIGDIDYSYTDIDIKQLYAQVFEEERRKNE